MRKILIALAIASCAGTASAQEHAGKAVTAGQSASETQSMPLVNGEVRKVERDKQKLTLRHEAIPNLDMPAMTMVFSSARPELLEGLKVGDKVRFAAERQDGRLTVIRIEPVR